MAGRKIALTLEGPSENNGRLELSVFAGKIRHFLDLLKRSAKESSEKTVVFHVVHLSHASPAIIECEPVAEDMTASMVALDFVDRSLACVEEENTQRLSHAVLSALEQLAESKPTTIERTEVRIIGPDAEDERAYSLDDEFRDRLSNARRVEERVVSTIDGRLEQINIHENANTFRIYISLPDFSYVNCEFQQNLFEKVQSSLGAFVSVSGECYYHPDAAFPYKMSVREMEILPPAGELPSLGDLYGIAPGATGDKSSEQFVRELRDKWDKGAQ